ncbi:protein of unknown function [Burkholderia multivorans]
MTIEKLPFDDDESLEYIAIDLRTTKYKNRLLEFLEYRNPASGDVMYRIRAEWTDDKFHPTMHLDEDDILKLSELFEEWVDKIKKRRAAVN